MWHLETLYIFRKRTVLQQFILCLNADTMALDSLKAGKTFSSWEEVEKFMNELESVNCRGNSFYGLADFGFRYFTLSETDKDL